MRLIEACREGRRNQVLYDRAYFLAGLVAADRLDALAFWGQLTDAGVRSGLEGAEIETTLASALRVVAAFLQIPHRGETAAFLAPVLVLI